MSPDKVVRALAAGNTVTPSGNVRVGDLWPMVPVNSVWPWPVGRRPRLLPGVCECPLLGGGTEGAGKLRADVPTNSRCRHRKTARFSADGWVRRNVRAVTS
jgi:hypothetical protein